MARTIGIDLGTTNSVVAFLEGTKVETIPNAEGSKLTPSCVYYKSDEEIIIGDLAKRQFLLDPSRCVRSVKRVVGKRFEDVEHSDRSLPYEVVQLDDSMAGVKLSDSILLRPEEISADILEKLRLTAEDFLGEKITQAVITVPAHFNDQQRTATKAAGEMAGFDVLRIINEPTAAALAYGFGGDHSGRVAIFDFGGGTFDVSILQITGDIFEVLSTNGDNNLGGDDIDQVLFEYLCDQIKEKTFIDPRGQVLAVQRIREAAEKAKCELSSVKATMISLPFIVADQAGPKHFELELKREEFNEMAEPIFQRLFRPCRQALVDAGIDDVSELESVLLVGGSTRIPRVQQLVTEFFGRPPSKTINPDEAVALGAAIQSGVITGQLREVLLLDVTPLTLGIELAGGVFKPIIPRNSTIPCEASDRFTTVVDNQSSVVVHVLQGERRVAAENHDLARFRLTGIPPAPKELPEIQVRFSIDANGILSVMALDLSSGQQTGVVVENYGDIGQRREIVEKIVEAGKEHLEADEEFIRFSHRRQNAERLQSKANRIVDALGNYMSKDHIKQVKEASFRMDVAMEKYDDIELSRNEDVLEDIISHYEENAELARVLARELGTESDEFPASTSSKAEFSDDYGAEAPLLEEPTATRGSLMPEEDYHAPEPVPEDDLLAEEFRNAPPLTGGEQTEAPPQPEPKKPAPPATPMRGPWTPAAKTAGFWFTSSFRRNAADAGKDTPQEQSAPLEFEDEAPLEASDEFASNESIHDVDTPQEEDTEFVPWSPLPPEEEDSGFEEDFSPPPPGPQ